MKDEKPKGPTEREIWFANEINDGYLQHMSDRNRFELYYYCEFCDAESITVSEGDDIDVLEIERILRHDPGCVVLEAKRTIIESFRQKYGMSCYEYDGEIVS